MVPIVNVPINNPAATATAIKTLSSETVPSRATDWSDEIKITAMTSSTIKIPKTSIEDSFLVFQDLQII